MLPIIMRTNLTYLLLLFGLSYVSCGSFGLPAIVDTGWDGYWSEVCDGRVDLGQRDHSEPFDQFEHFLRMGRERFGEENPLFQAKTNLAGFVDLVVREILGGKREARGLLAAQMMLQYLPLDLAGEDLRPAQDVMRFAAGNMEPADAEAAANIAAICRNLGIPIPESYANMASSYALPFERDPLRASARCSLKDFGPDSPLLSVQTLAAFLGDGAIDGEVDADFNPLEGHSTAITACVMANLLSRLAEDKVAIDVGGLDRADLARDADLFMQAAASRHLMAECAKYAMPEEAFEMALLERLRSLEADEQILLSTGFSQHAMAMAIKRTGPTHYELLIFNSGRGIAYHESSVDASRRKIFPAKRFSELTLLRLKWSQVLQRLYHVDAIGDRTIENPESDTTSSTTAEDLYVTALAGLKKHERQFTEADMEVYRLFVAQRSGNCSAEALMAFLAHHSSRPYQLLKVLLYKDLLELAFQKQLTEEEKPVVHRLLKYGLEQHARTVLRFRRQNPAAELPFRHLLPEGLWPKYARVKDVYTPARPAEFRVDTESLRGSSEFYDHLMKTASMLHAGVNGELEASAAVRFAPAAHCPVAAWHVFAYRFGDGRDSFAFRGHLLALLSYMQGCRFRTDSHETLQFLAFHVIRRWPEPKAPVWRALLGPENEAHREHLEALWFFVQQLLQTQLGHGGIYAYTCLHKIMMIAQHALDAFLPGLASCRVRAPFYMDSSAHYCLSHEIASYFERTASEATEPCFADDGRPTGRLLKHLQALANTYSSQYGAFDDDLQPLAILRDQRHANIPAALYYWHVLRNAVATLERNAPGGWNASFLQLPSPEYKPCHDMLDIGDLTRGVSNESVPINPKERRKPRAVAADKEYDWSEDHQVYGDARQNVLMTVLSSKYDQLGRFIHLLRVAPDDFDWSTALQLGTLVVHRPQPLSTIVNAIAYLAGYLDELRAELIAQSEYLAGPAIRNPGMKRKAECYAALIIIESILAGRHGPLDGSRKHLSDLKVLLDSARLHSTYRAMLVFAYLASMPKDPLMEEAENVILLYREYSETLKKHMSDEDDLLRYRDHLQANVIAAFFAIAQSPRSDGVIRRIIGDGRGDLVPHGFLSTSQHTSSNYLFDFISGFEVSRGFVNIETTAESLRQHYRQVMLPEPPEGVRIGPAKTMLQQGGSMLRCSIEGGGWEFQRGALHYKLADVDVSSAYGSSPGGLSPSLTVIREGYTVTSNALNEYRQAIRLPYHSFKDMPIPALVDNGKPCSLLVFPEQGEAALLNETEQIWIDAGGLLTFHDALLKGLQYMPFTSPSDFVSPLATYKDAFCFKDPNGTFLLLLRQYADASGNPLWLIQAKDGKWELLSDRKFHVRPDQAFATAGMLAKYLLLEGRERNHKVLLPEEYHQITGKGGKLDDVRMNCLSISLTRTAKGYTKDEYMARLTSAIKKEGHQHIHSLIPHSKSRQESLLLLYNYLVTRHYHEAMKEADKIHQMEPFDGNECRLLGWIAKSHTAMKNGSPESIAIRSYICFHVFNNEMLFHSLGEPDPSLQYTGPYMQTSKWLQYWAGKHIGIAAQVISQYVDRLKKIPHFLRLDPEASFPRVSPVQWRTWLSELERSPKSDLGLLRYLQPTDHRYFDKPRGTSNVVADRFDRPGEILGILNDIDQMLEAMPAKSFLAPSILTDKRNWLMAKILSRQLPTDAAERLDQWLQPYENIPQHATVARTLRKALSISQSPISFDRRQTLEELIAGQPTAANSRVSLPYHAGSARQFPENTYDSPISTPNIKDNIFGAPLPLGEIKRRKCKGEELDSIIDPILAQASKFLKIPDGLLYGHGNRQIDWSQKLKLIQRLLKLYAMHFFNSFKSLGYQEHERRIHEDSEVGKGLEYIAHGQISITASDIIHMYAKAQKQYYLQYFPYFEDDTEKLHRIATQFVLTHSNWQEIKRFRKFIASNSDPARRDQEKCQLCRSTETSMNNMLAYECFINSRLTKEQVEKITELTAKRDDGWYPDMFVHWIMSAGKTYILGTLLSVMKADHDHLSILVVPKSLLTGEASNLFSRTIAAFNRDGFSFHLARDPKLADFKTLAWINEAIHGAAKRGQYIIMSADMMESLHDKFVELGRDGDRKRREYEEMRQMLRKIRVWGAMTVDEAHKIFEPTQETNFPIATTKANVSDKNSPLALEGYILTEVFRMVAEYREFQKHVLRMNIAENRPLEHSRTGHVITSVGKHLVKAFDNHESALFKYIKQVDADVLKSFSSFNKDDLYTFITKDPKTIKTSEIKKIERNASPAVYRALAVCRLAVTSLIPLAWSGNVNENYGREPGTKYALPFSAAFAPKIGSEFAFRWYCYGRTIRTYLVKGLDEETLRWALAWLQNWALKNITLPPAKQSELPGNIIHRLLGLSSIYDLNPQNGEQLADILEICKRYHKCFIEDDNSLSPNLFNLYSEFLFRWIAEDVIPSISYYSEQLSANSQDISYMVSSRQLYSGSVISKRTFPRQFLEDSLVTIDESIDSKIIEAIGHNKIGVAVVPDGLSADKFVGNSNISCARAKIKNEKSTLVAVLDVGAYFKDQTNEQVAASLLSIQHSVLYFSTDKNKLALITRDDPNEKILHTYSAEIIREHVPDARNRITFYDQQHNTGVDIFQDLDGCAMIIIGAKTTSIDFYQSVMRMRGFLETQKLFIIVPQHVTRMMPRIFNHDSVPTVDQLLQFMENNLQNSVMNLNAMALSQMIAAVFKEAAYRRLLNDSIDKRVLSLWVKDTSSEINDLVVPQRYRDYRKRVVPSIIATYAARVKQYFKPEELEDLIFLAEKTVDKAFGRPADGSYPSRSLCSVSSVEEEEIDDDAKDQAFKIVENKDSDMLAITTAETETQIVTEALHSVHSSNAKIGDRVNWNFKQIPGNVYNVNGLLNHYTLTGATLFSPSLYISYGFTVRGTKFGVHRKFAPQCLALFDENRKYLMMVDQFEAAEISEILEKGRLSWHGSIVSGLISDNALDYTIFGMNAALVDPVRGTIDFGKAPLRAGGEMLSWLQPLMVEVMFFAGYMKELLMPMHKDSLLGFLESPRPWPHLDSTRSKSYKMALLTDVIVSEEEIDKSTEYLANGESLIGYVGVPLASYQEARRSDSLTMFNFVSQNRGKLEMFVYRVQTAVLLHHFDDLLQCNQVSEVLNPHYLDEALLAALTTFFRNPSMAQRDNFGRNASAVSSLFASQRHVPAAVANGVLHILHNCDAYPHWRSYEVLFNLLSSRILHLVNSNHVEQWIHDYLKALAGFQNLEQCSDLFAALTSPYSMSRVPGIEDSPYLEVFMTLLSTTNRFRLYSFTW